MRIDPNAGNHDHVSKRTPIDKTVERSDGAKPATQLLESPEKRADIKPLANGQGKSLDLRNFTPRQMADLSMDLYVSDILEWEEYAMLAFQPELHPDYDRTIGALTGEKAKPDGPRDFISEWETRHRFEEKHNSKDRELVQRTLRIVNVLKQIVSPTNLVA
jgi:hypothetical protein